METNIQGVNRKKSVHSKNRKVIIKLILLQLVMLAIASHYAHAKLYGIIKYYLLELCGVCCLMCGIVYISDVFKKRKKLKSVQKAKKPLKCCPVDEVERTKDGVKIYNYNWIIKDESKLAVEKENKKECTYKECTQKEEITKQVYRSPFDKLVNTDKKVLYKSPFDSISSRRVMIVLDSAREDGKFVLCKDIKYCGRFRHVSKDRYVLSKDVRYCGRFRHVVKDRYVLSGDVRYCGRFRYVAKDRYVLCKDIRYCGRFFYQSFGKNVLISVGGYDKSHQNLK